MAHNDAVSILSRLALELTSTYVICACETSTWRCLWRHCWGCVCLVYTPRRIVGSTFRRSETGCFWGADSNVVNQAGKYSTTMNSSFGMTISAMMRSTKTKYAASFPDELFAPFHILFFRSRHVFDASILIHISFDTTHSDFDAFVYSDELVCRTALFPPHTRLVVADIFFAAAESGRCEVLQHLSREHNALNFVFVQLS